MRALILGFMFLGMSNLAMALDGSIGCGPGNFVVQKNSWIATTTRGLTNYTCSFTVVGGMTSGTSGCQQHSLVKAESSDMFFIQANLDILGVEMAQGKGEHMVGLAKTLGCDDLGTEHFVKAAKGQYRSVYTKENSGLKMLDNVHGLIKSDASLSLHCKKVLI